MISNTIHDAGGDSTRTPLFVKCLNRKALKIIAAVGRGYETLDIFYISKDISAEMENKIRQAGASLSYVDFHLFPEEYFNCERELCVASRDLMESAAIKAMFHASKAYINSGADHFKRSMQKSLVYLIGNDFKLFFLAKKLGKLNNAIFLVMEIELLSMLFPNSVMLKEGVSIKRMSLAIGIFVVMLFRVLFYSGKNLERGSRLSILFDPLFTYVNGGNPEFKAFYSYLKDRDDVIYICRGGKSELRSFLESEGKPIAVVSWGVRGFGKKVSSFLATVSLARVVFLDRNGWGLKCAIAKIKSKELYFSCLFENMKPKVYLQVRSDMDEFHPIATGIIEQHGGAHVGYMTGSYFTQTRDFYTIDFHVYGLLGRYFKENIYKSVWPDDIQYLLVGAITSEASGYNRTKKPRFAVSLATTSFGNGIWMQEDYYKGCIDAFFYSVSGMEGEMALREKDPRGELIESFVEGCATKYGVNFTLSVPCDVGDEGVHSSYSDEFVLDSEIIVIMGTSTIGWEALGLRKKFIIFGQEGIGHPFEDMLPKLVVRTKEELRDRIDWLLAMHEAEFCAMTKPLMDWMCRESTGNMVEMFINKSLTLSEKGTV